MNNELMKALDVLEEEKGIKKSIVIEAIENSLITACQKHFPKTDNIKVTVDRETCEFSVVAEKEVVETVEEGCQNSQISLENAKLLNAKYALGDIVNVPFNSKEFSRIAASNAKSVIQQKIREEEKKLIFNDYYEKEKDIITGIVQKIDENNNVHINLGKLDALLVEKEQVKTEHFEPTERIKLFIVEVQDGKRGPKVIISRTHPDLIKRLFESEVAEVQSGVVEIKSISREAGSRTKIAVWSNDSNVDPVGACVGVNGARVNAIVSELRGEKIDIVEWSEDPAIFIENSLSPAEVISVTVYDDRTAEVVVPDKQLSLAIGKEGQNARLAARLTGYKIDIKSEAQIENGEGDYDDNESFDVSVEE